MLSKREIILITLVIVIGVVAYGFASIYLVPQVTFLDAQKLASYIASTSSLSASIVNSTAHEVSLKAMLYNHAFNGTAYVLVLTAPSAGVYTPSSIQPFSVCWSKAPAVQISSPIYDTSGKILYAGQATLYKVSFNTPLTITIDNVNPNDIVIWFIVNEGGYWFRVAFSYPWYF